MSKLIHTLKLIDVSTFLQLSCIAVVAASNIICINSDKGLEGFYSTVALLGFEISCYEVLVCVAVEGKAQYMNELVQLVINLCAWEERLPGGGMKL